MKYFGILIFCFVGALKGFGQNLLELKQQELEQLKQQEKSLNSEIEILKLAQCLNLLKIPGYPVSFGALQTVVHAAYAMDPVSLATARDAINAKLGPVSILVSAAGGHRPDATLPPGSDFCKLPTDAWNAVFYLNLVGGALLPAQVFGETMLQQARGSIINIASMAGMIPL